MSDAGLSAEREAKIRSRARNAQACYVGTPNAMAIKLLGWDVGEVLAALDAERERRCRAEQEADTLAEALRKLVFSVNLSRARRGAREALAGYRADDIVVTNLEESEALEERVTQAEQQADTLAEAAWAELHGRGNHSDCRICEALAGYRAGRDEAKP